MGDWPSSPHRVRVRHSVAQTVADGGVLLLAFDTEVFDSHGLHDTATNNSRLTAKVSGTYVIHGNAEFAGNANGQRMLKIKLNGLTYIAKQLVPVNSTDTFGVNIGTIYDLAAGDYVELEAYQQIGGGTSLNVNSNNDVSPSFSMVRVG